MTCLQIKLPLQTSGSCSQLTLGKFSSMNILCEDADVENWTETGSSACPQIKLTEALTTFHMVCFILLSYKFSDIEIWINRASIPAVWSHYKTPRSASSPTLHLLFPADTRTQCDVFLHHQQTTFRLSLRPFVEAEQKMGNRWQSGRYQKDPACLTFQSLPVTITVHLVCKSSGRKMKTERFSCVRFVEQTERLWILVFVH